MYGAQAKARLHRDAPRGAVRDTPRDPKFWQAFQDGAEWALASIYEEQAPALYRFLGRGFSFSSGQRQLRAARLGAHGLDLDDLVQETFRRAFGRRARAAYDGVRPYRNYLFTIARNVALTELARGQRVVPMGEAFAPGPELERLSPTERQVARALRERDGDGLEATLEGRELAGLVNRFVAALSPEEAEVFTARFVEDRPQQQLADALGCTRSRVRSLETQLRRRFQDTVRDSGYFDQRRPTRRTLAMCA